MNQKQKDRKIKRSKAQLNFTKVFIVAMIAAMIIASAFLLIYLVYPSNERLFIKQVDKALTQQYYVDGFLENNFILSDDLLYLSDSISDNFSYTRVDNLKINVSEDDENIIEYECDISSPAYTALNLTVNGYFDGTQGITEIFHIEGSAKIERDGLKRKIVVDADNTLFYLLFTFRNVPSGAGSRNIDAILQDNYVYLTSEYMIAADLNQSEQIEFIEQANMDFDYLMIMINRSSSEYIPRLSDESNHYIKQLKVDKQPGQNRTLYIFLGSIVLSIVLLIVSTKLRDHCEEKVDMCRHIETDEAKKIRLEKEERAIREAEERARKRRILDIEIHRGKMQLSADEKQVRDDIFISELKKYDFSSEIILKPIMGLVFNPSSNKTIINLLKSAVIESSNYRSKGARRDIYISETIFGWGICALARCITINAGDTIAFNQNAFRDVTKEYFELSSKIQELQKSYQFIINTYFPESKNQSSFKYSTSTTYGRRLKETQDELNELSKKWHSNFVGYCLSQDTDFTFDTLIYVIQHHSTFKFSEFLLQNLVVGFYPYMNTYKDSSQIKNLYTDLMSMKRQITDWDEYRGFFEVRLNRACDSEMFAGILEEILLCANLPFEYADMHKMADILIAEIPGIMELLCEYPLRLIDSSIKFAKGFMKVKAFDHGIMTKYFPPKNAGPVILRYNRIVDQTLPNSAGINMQLFCDSYSAVPLLYHEFLHFLGHKNEAAVFLATYNFCDYFYNKYDEAVKTLFYDYNYTYIHMKTQLQDKSKQEQIDFINDMIYQRYGKKMSIADAKKRAAEVVFDACLWVQDVNQNQEWHKDVPCPLLTPDADPNNSITAYNAEIRLLTADKKIDSESYDTYQNKWNTLITSPAIAERRSIEYDDLKAHMIEINQKIISMNKARTNN